MGSVFTVCRPAKLLLHVSPLLVGFSQRPHAWVLAIPAFFSFFSFTGPLLDLFCPLGLLACCRGTLLSGPSHRSYADAELSPSWDGIE